jgi:hypothetical protein
MEGAVEKLAAIAIGVVMMAAATGQLPRFISQVRIAQLELLQESQASKWGDPIILQRVSDVRPLTAKKKPAH